jgi:cellobiose phosphorylase
MSLRAELCLDAGETVTLAFITGVCTSKEEAKLIGEELSVAYRMDDILEKYRLQKDIELKYLEISKAQLNAFQELISPIFYPSNLYRGPGEYILRNEKNQSNLWRFGISGDQPILLLQVSDISEERMIRDVLKANEYLRINKIPVDLVILTAAAHGYLQEVDYLINELTSSLRIYDSDGEKPSFFMLHTYDLSQTELDLLYTVARVVFSNETGIYFKNAKDNLFETLEEYEA